MDGKVSMTEAATQETTYEDVSSTEPQVRTEIDPERKKYNLAATEFTITVNPYPQLARPIFTTHVVRRPTLDEEERKERMTPLLTKSAGRVDNVQAQQTEVDIVPGDRALYDKIVKRVFGYQAKAGQAPPKEGLLPTDLVEALDPKTEAVVEKPIVEVIPDDHKSLVVNSLFPSQFEMHDDGEMVGFSFVGGQEWTLRQDIGGKEQLDDGTFSPAEYVLLYRFKEPTATQMKAFRSKAFAVKSWADRQGVQNEERRVVLSVMVGLFDNLLVSLDGAIIDSGSQGEAFDARNRQHVALIPGQFKKGAMLKLFTFLQADLGKSQGS
jgi:hypothetical protein